MTDRRDPERSDATRVGDDAASSGARERETTPARITPERFDAVVFDMDGVVTDTASAHAAAWKRLFDDVLKARADRAGRDFEPFDAEEDYLRHVDGKPRLDGVRDFLASRGIEVDEGGPEDGPDADTVHGLGARKNGYFNDWLAENRVAVWPDAIRLIRGLRAEGVRCAVVSSSRNASAVLENAGVSDLFEAQVDGVEAARLDLPGKPDPAIFVEAARRLGATPDRAAALEDAQVGVEACARGGFALVVGVDRSKADGAQAEALRSAGAHVVVRDLARLAPAGADERPVAEVPALRDHEAELAGELRGRRLAVFLDYDGTLTPIVKKHDEAALGDATRETLRRLAAQAPLAIVSGRDLADLRDRVGLPDLFYAGSHGFDIAGPEGWRETIEKGADFLPDLDAAEKEMREAVAAVDGAALERKRFSIAVHYRNAGEGGAERVRELVDRLLSRRDRLRSSSGKKVIEIQPRVDWDKGRAVRWLLERLDLDRPDVIPIYVGDDVTDEDAFRAFDDIGRGVAVVVRGEDDARPTRARYALDDPDEVRRFLDRLPDIGGET